MITVEEARARIVAAFAPVSVETINVADALGRVLAEDVAARVTQPPSAVSAMDGYAVRAADVAKAPVVLKLVGAAPAGSAHDGAIQPGECVRIFTGGPLPPGADTVIIQEDVTAEGERITVREPAPLGHYVRAAGLDFRAGEIGLRAGRLLGARDIGLAAAMNHPWLKVRRKPRVAILATGNELVMPGEPVGPNQVVSSNGLALAALVSAWGGQPVQLGIAPDSAAALQQVVSDVHGVDLLITSGGVSVGDHDLVRSALAACGLAIDFWRIAMRPGKPLMFGRIGDTRVLGMPGNPVSSLVCAYVFLRPALAAMLDLTQERNGAMKAALGRDLPANDHRQDYLRAVLAADGTGLPIATPYERQDSSMLATLARADCLVIRPPNAPAASAGDVVDVLQLRGGLIGL